MSISPLLHLLRKDFTLLLRTICHLIIILHFRFLLRDRDHAIQISGLHWQYLHHLLFCGVSISLLRNWDSAFIPFELSIKGLRRRLGIWILSVCSFEIIASIILVWLYIIVHSIFSPHERLLLLHLRSQSI